MGRNFTLETGNCNLTVKNIHCLNPDYTLDCGQSFRWEKTSEGHWCAVVSSESGPVYCELSFSRNKDGTCDITFYDCDEKAFNEIWVPYFDLDRDYDSILGTYNKDKYLKQADKEYYGIRVTNQDPWETLCSFIISQNNNIPRIKGIIERLCENFGEPVRTIKTADGTDKTLYSFPTAEKLARLEPEDLAPIRAGFRNKYIIDAARKTAGGEINLERLKELPLEEAEAELLKIKGVGPKVAQCVLLYGCRQADAFPQDVWVKRILSELYPQGLPPCTAGTRGIAQQYLFHWRRHLDDTEKGSKK